MNIEFLTIVGVLPVLSNVAEKLVADQFVTSLNSTSSALHPVQFGFWKQDDN